MIHFRTAVVILFAILSVMPATAQKQRGKATFYSKRATGARTASGERLHHDSLTCAHRTYPFGTVLKVTNLSNNKTVYVRVTDRGPFSRGRIVDLSWRAAKELGILSQGVAPVEIERYEEINVPFRASDKYDLPEIDFSFSDNKLDYFEENKKAATEKLKRKTRTLNHKNNKTQK